MTAPPPVCADCRFYNGSLFCQHIAAKTFDVVTGERRRTLNEMRHGGRCGERECGWDGKLFEPKPPPTFLQRWGCLFFLIALVGVVLVMIWVQR